MLVDCKDMKEIIELYKDGHILGKGTTAIVYLKNDKAIKVYQDSKSKRMVFKEFDMKIHLEELSQLKVKNVCTPNEIYLVNDEVKATSLDHINGKTLKEEIPDISMDLFLEYLESLIESVYKLSENCIWVRDFFSGNAIVNQNGINIIDTDDFYFSCLDEETCLEHNMIEILHDIFEVTFGFKKNFHFYSESLDLLLSDYLDVFAPIDTDFALYNSLRKELGGKTSVKNLKILIKTLGEVKI